MFQIPDSFFFLRRTEINRQSGSLTLGRTCENIKECFGEDLQGGFLSWKLGPLHNGLSYYDAFCSHPPR